jgi:DNA repair protein RecN (Recombination protein N)
VQKNIIGERTETIATSLNEADRIQELSRMLGGETITQTTRRYALEMLERSERLGQEE